MSLASILAAQSGVVARFQLVALGLKPHDVERLLRKRELVPVWSGVYVAHTGVPTGEERRAAAVLRYWPAALGGRSALGLCDGREIEIIVEPRRSLSPVEGIVLRTTTRFDRVRVRPFPPRQRPEDAALDVASRLADPLETFTFLAEVLQTRTTSAPRIAAEAASRSRLANRSAIVGALSDLAGGSESVLEAEWARVAAKHGLPLGASQAPARAGGHRIRRDRLYREWGVVVELDGRAFHDTAAARDRDHARDLAALSAEGLVTVRLTYGQVFGQPCLTARQVGEVLRSRGWAGALRICKFGDCS